VQPRFVYRVLDQDGSVLLQDLRLGQTSAPEAGAASVEAEGDGSGEDELGFGSEADREALPPGQLIAKTHAYLATDLLRGVVNHPRGTGRKARALGRPVAGKTGTTNDQGDAWFIGFSPDVVTGVWVGYDEKRVLGRGETGGRAALPIWIDFMQSALTDAPQQYFDLPDNVSKVHIDPDTGKRAGDGSTSGVPALFIKGTEPR